MLELIMILFITLAIIMVLGIIVALYMTLRHKGDIDLEINLRKGILNLKKKK